MKIDSFHIDSDGEYLVAFADEYLTNLRAVYKTIVMDNDLSVLRVLDSAYEQIIEGGYVFTNAYPLQIRYTIKKDLVEVIGKAYWFDEARESNELVGLKTFFYDRKESWVEEINADSMDISLGNEDVTVLINDAHALHVAVVDHRSNQIEYYTTFWHFNNILEKDGQLIGRVYQGSLESSYPLPEGDVLIVFEDQM